MAFSNLKSFKLFPIIAGMVLTFAVGVTVVVLQHQQEVRSRASTANEPFGQNQPICWALPCAFGWPFGKLFGTAASIAYYGSERKDLEIIGASCVRNTAIKSYCYKAGGNLQCPSSQGYKSYDINSKVCGGRSGFKCCVQTAGFNMSKCSDIANAGIKVNNSKTTCSSTEFPVDHYWCLNSSGTPAERYLCVPKSIGSSISGAINCAVSKHGKCQASTTSCSGTKLTNVCGGGLVCCAPKTTTPSSGCSGDACHIGKSCSTSLGGGTCRYRNSYNCNGTWVIGKCPGSTNVVCCVQKTTTPPASGQTKLSFENGLFIHGIGKAGDSQNPGEQGGGTNPPVHLQREVTVDIYNFEGTQVVMQNLKVHLNFGSATGDFKHDSSAFVNLSPSFVSGAYVVKVKMSQSLRKAIPMQITAGAVNKVPVTTLITGDSNGDNKVNFEDYKIIKGCVSEFEAAEDCPGDNKTKADITDDNSVTLPDLNLFLRELSNKQGE